MNKMFVDSSIRRFSFNTRQTTKLHNSKGSTSIRYETPGTEFLDPDFENTNNSTKIFKT